MPSLARIEAMLEALVVACVKDKKELADLARSLANIGRNTMDPEHIKELRAIAEEIHCPDSEGGKVAAAIKAKLLALAKKMEATPTPEAPTP